jgi:integrase
MRLVFSSIEGGPLRRNNFYTRHFKPALRGAGPDEMVRFHDRRHSAASIAIAMGANVKQVQQMLGHTSATVTLDTYSHDPVAGGTAQRGPGSGCIGRR